MQPILVPLDFSAGTGRLISAAEELASYTGCPLVFLHVVEPQPSYVPVGASMDVIAPPALELVDVGTGPQRERCDALAAGSRSRGFDAEAVVLPGLAAEEILAQAQTRKARYIVMASHGHGALYHLFTGSVVTAVLRLATQPVVVVPVRGHA